MLIKFLRISLYEIVIVICITTLHSIRDRIRESIRASISDRIMDRIRIRDRI